MSQLADQHPIFLHAHVLQHPLQTSTMPSITELTMSVTRRKMEGKVTQWQGHVMNGTDFFGESDVVLTMYTLNADIFYIVCWYLHFN